MNIACERNNQIYWHCYVVVCVSRTNIVPKFVHCFDLVTTIINECYSPFNWLKGSFRLLSSLAWLDQLKFHLTNFMLCATGESVVQNLF